MKTAIKNELKRAVGITYQAVAMDFAGELEDMMDDTDWAEVVMDADRIFMFGSLSPEATKTLKAMSWDERIRFANGCRYW